MIFSYNNITTIINSFAYLFIKNLIYQDTLISRYKDIMESKTKYIMIFSYYNFIIF